MNFPLNAVQSPPDSRDFVFSQEGETPTTFDMRPSLLPVRNQGAQGSCFAMSTACMKEYQERKDYGLKEYLSPQFFYDQRFNLYDARGDNDEGMYGRDVMTLLSKVGICTEQEYPYGTPQDRTDVTTDIYESASKHRVAGYAAVRTLNALKKSLVDNGPCLIGFPVYHYGEYMWKPEYEGQPMSGGHAMTVVGYTEDSFIIRNSWGDRWGDGGYCYYPFEDWGAHWELWTTIDADTVIERQVESEDEPEDDVEPEVEDEPEAEDEVEDDVEPEAEDEDEVNPDPDVNRPHERRWWRAIAYLFAGCITYLCLSRQTYKSPEK